MEVLKVKIRELKQIKVDHDNLCIVLASLKAESEISDDLHEKERERWRSENFTLSSELANSKRDFVAQNTNFILMASRFEQLKKDLESSLEEIRDLKLSETELLSSLTESEDKVMEQSQTIQRYSTLMSISEDQLISLNENANRSTSIIADLEFQIASKDRHIASIERESGQKTDLISSFFNYSTSSASSPVKSISSPSPTQDSTAYKPKKPVPNQLFFEEADKPQSPNKSSPPKLMSASRLPIQIKPPSPSPRVPNRAISDASLLNRTAIEDKCTILLDSLVNQGLTREDVANELLQLLGDEDDDGRGEN